MSNRAKLKKFKDQSKKAYTENVNEVVDELQFERDMANPRAISGVKSLNAIKRAIRQEIPDSTRKWLEANGHGDLWPKYKKWVKGVAKEKNRLASALANELGLDLEKEHWTPVAGMGDIPPKMPFTSVSDRGPDSEGGTGSGKFNRRVGNKPVFQRKVLQQLGVATNWQESVSNFVADRPDIKDVAERKKLNLQPLPVRKASNLALLKLQQKDLTGGQLESMMDLEYDLKKSGIISSTNDESLLNNYLDKINTKETAAHAEKHSWKRNSKGELILDQNKKPIPSGQWDLNTKEAHRSTDEWFTKRKADSINAVKRRNPKFTKLNPKNISRALAANAAYSFVNPRSIRAATNIIAEGPNKENIKEVGLGIRDDLIHTGVVKALGAATGAKALAIGGTAAAVPLGVGLVGGMTLNSIVEGATGKNLKEIGEQAEEKKLYRDYHGLTNKKSDRQNYRHSTSPKVTTEMLEDWDTEIRQGWYEDSLEDRQLNSSVNTKRLLKAI